MQLNADEENRHYPASRGIQGRHAPFPDLAGLAITRQEKQSFSKSEFGGPG
jgi:hypothetical protein